MLVKSTGKNNKCCIQDIGQEKTASRQFPKFRIIWFRRQPRGHSRDSDRLSTFPRVPHDFSRQLAGSGERSSWNRRVWRSFETCLLKTPTVTLVNVLESFGTLSKRHLVSSLWSHGSHVITTTIFLVDAAWHDACLASFDRQRNYFCTLSQRANGRRSRTLSGPRRDLLEISGFSLYIIRRRSLDRRPGIAADRGVGAAPRSCIFCAAFELLLRSSFLSRSVLHSWLHLVSIFPPFFKYIVQYAGWNVVSSVALELRGKGVGGEFEKFVGSVRRCSEAQA